MSGGGRIQLNSVGAPDIYLTSDPETSHFLKRYKRHSHFAIQTAEVPFEQPAAFGGRVKATIPRIGDLVREVYVKVTLPEIDQSLLQEWSSSDQQNVDVKTYPTYCDSIGHALIQQADLSIGGQVVESINGDYLDIYDEFFTPVSQERAIEQLAGRIYSRTGLGPASNVVHRTENGFDANGAFPRTFIVPLRFWFTNDTNLALPLCALKRQEVDVSIRIEEIEKLVVSEKFSINEFLRTTAQLGGKPLEIESMSLLVDYVFLTDEEALQFETSSLNYLITQIQGVQKLVPSTDSTTTLRTTFTNPVKEMFIIVQNTQTRKGDSTLQTDYFNYKSSAGLDNLNNLELTFNGEVRIDKDIADGFYLRNVQPLQCHTRVPRRYIYNYSFAITPESYEPTGQVNMSRINDVLFNLELGAANNQERVVKIYVKNYNVLRIESGLGGVLFNFNG